MFFVKSMTFGHSRVGGPLVRASALRMVRSFGMHATSATVGGFALRDQAVVHRRDNWVAATGCRSSHVEDASGTPLLPLSLRRGLVASPEGKRWPSTGTSNLMEQAI